MAQKVIAGCRCHMMTSARDPEIDFFILLEIGKNRSFERFVLFSKLENNSSILDQSDF